MFYSGVGNGGGSDDDESSDNGDESRNQRVDLQCPATVAGAVTATCADGGVAVYKKQRN